MVKYMPEWSMHYRGSSGTLVEAAVRVMRLYRMDDDLLFQRQQGDPWKIILVSPRKRFA